MNAENDPDAGSPLKFPCSFPIKVMGRHEPGFQETVLALVSRHSGEVLPGQVQSRASSNGNFLSVTITIVAESRTQLDEIYRSLTASEQVIMVL